MQIRSFFCNLLLFIFINIFSISHKNDMIQTFTALGKPYMFVSPSFLSYTVNNYQF